MGRVIANLTIKGFGSTLSSDTVVCDAMVDTGAAHLIIPYELKGRLGHLEKIRNVDCSLVVGETTGEIFAPVTLTINQFDPIMCEVLCIHGCNEILLGYLPLEAASLAVDMVGHRLVHVKAVDLK
ncbi:MAG: hypothetical protein AAB035_02930 [Nitrospirota bacterium]